MLCKQFTSNYANSSGGFAPRFLPCSDLKLTPAGLSTSHAPHVAHQEQLLGELRALSSVGRKYQSTSRPVAEPGVPGGRAGFNDKYSPFPYLPN